MKSEKREINEKKASISKKTIVEIGIVVSCILLMLAEASVQTYFQELYFAGQLTKTQEWLATHFFNHIGDTTDGFSYVFGLIVIPELVRRNSKSKESTTIALSLKAYSLLVLALIGYIIFDAETTQTLTGLFRSIGIDPGISEKKDIFFGFYGMFGGIALYDLAFGILSDKSIEE